MLRGLLFVTLGALAGCPPQPTCPSGSGRTIETMLFAVEGVERATTMRFPAPTCALPEGTLTASATFEDEQGTRTPATISRLEHEVAAGGVVVEVRFSARAPGAGRLQVFVDPQLGIAQVPVLVARDGAKLAFDDLRAPCARPQRLASGPLVCELDGGVALVVDGGAQALLPQTGTPQVVGDVLWVDRRGDDGGWQLQRHAWVDGGLVPTHAAEVGAPTGLPLYADEASTVRNGLLLRADDDGGLAAVPSLTSSRTTLLVPEPQTLWAWNSDRWCAMDGGCLSFGTTGAKLAGLERAVWWEATTTGQLLVHRRPIADVGSIATLPLFAQQLSLANRPVRGVARPVWDEPAGGLFVLSWRGDAITATAFSDRPRGEENVDFVSFLLDGGVVRFVRLP